MFTRMLQSTAAPLLLLAGLLGSGLAQADGADRVAAQCAQCHAIERPDYETLGPDERMQRKAPPLYYAGNKYNEDWLSAWLQQPERIHPTGYYPAIAVKHTPSGDMPDPEALHDHLALDAASAQAVVSHLMSLRPHDDLIAADNYSPGTVSMRMGQMDFRRFKGCNACHQDAPDEGGFSGPVVYNAWERLQPAYISSFLQQPTAWDPNTVMSVPQMNEEAVHKLVHYLRALGGEK